MKLTLFIFRLTLDLSSRLRKCLFPVVMRSKCDAFVFTASYHKIDNDDDTLQAPDTQVLKIYIVPFLTTLVCTKFKLINQMTSLFFFSRNSVRDTNFESTIFQCKNYTKHVHTHTHLSFWIYSLAFYCCLLFNCVCRTIVFLFGKLELAFVARQIKTQ